MPYSYPATTLEIYDKTLDGLALFATIDSGTIPTTAGIFAPGGKVLDLSTGVTYTNTGTTAVPTFLASTTALTATVALTAANLIAMYATPVAVIPAVSGRAIVVDSVSLVITRTSTAFTGGGAVQVQYAATAHAAGTAVSATIASTVVTGAAGTTYTARIPADLSDVASASIAGVGLYISNDTAAFAAGTGTASLVVRYHLV